MIKKAKNPWKVLSSNVVYSSRFLKVIEDQIIDPQGKPGIHNLVSPGDYVGGVSIVALAQDNYIYLVRQYRYAFEDYTLELIGGSIEKGKSPLEAAKNELREEAGLKAKSWELLHKTHPATEVHKNSVTIFLATDLIECSESTVVENNMTVMKIPLAKAVEFVLKGKIPLTSSALGILLVARRLDL